METKYYTITIYCENQVGLLSRLTSILTRRKINIESLTTSSTVWEGIHCMTLLISILPEAIENLVLQIEKQIEVLQANYHQDDELIFQEVALFKLPTIALTNQTAVEQLVRNHHARIISIEPDFMVIEKTGHETEIQTLMQQLLPFGLLNFARSGRVAIPKEAPLNTQIGATPISIKNKRTFDN
jgi:acetolactate synthase-1/3 small subunit